MPHPTRSRIDPSSTGHFFLLPWLVRMEISFFSRSVFRTGHVQRGGTDRSMTSNITIMALFYFRREHNCSCMTMVTSRLARETSHESYCGAYCCGGWELERKYVHCFMLGEVAGKRSFIKNIVKHHFASDSAGAELGWRAARPERERAVSCQSSYDPLSFGLMKAIGLVDEASFGGSIASSWAGSLGKLQELKSGAVAELRRQTDVQLWGRGRGNERRGS
jgi:hypothetical protein